MRTKEERKNKKGKETKKKQEWNIKERKRVTNKEAHKQSI